MSSSDENNIGSIESLDNIFIDDTNCIEYLQLDPIDRVVRNVAGKLRRSPVQLLFQFSF